MRESYHQSIANNTNQIYVWNGMKVSDWVYISRDIMQKNFWEVSNPISDKRCEITIHLLYQKIFFFKQKHSSSLPDDCK